MPKLNTLNKVRNYINTHALLSPKDTVIIGVSGGADSMALLSILKELQTEFSLNLHVCHVNHGIRGEEAKRDEEHVQNYCLLNGINCDIIKHDIPLFAKQNKLSDEEAGRILRYQSFNKLSDKLSEDKKTVKIAIAHNKEDNAETVLLQLLRGSGLVGLSGIKPKRDIIIRPLLDISRQEIEEYLIQKNISYITDSSNLSNDYTRNILRNRVFPIFKSQINSLSVDNINKAASFICEADSYIEKQAGKVFDSCVSTFNNSLSIDCLILKKHEHIIRSYVIRKSLKIFFDKLKDIESVHVEALDKLLFMNSGKKINLPYCSHAYKEYDKIYVCRNDNISSISDYSKDSFSFEILENTCISTADTKYIKYFDFDKLKELPTVRTRQSGDIISIKNGNKKLNSFMTDEKIPPKSRDAVLLLAKGKEIIWILGYRISEKYKVGKNTKKILKISYKGD